MVAVNTLRGIGYGFRLMIYALLVVLFGIVPAAVGARLVMEGTFNGVILVLIGVLITYAGSLGMLYKVIADAVARGNKAVDKEVEISNAEEIGGTIEELSEKIDEINED